MRCETGADRPEPGGQPLPQLADQTFIGRAFVGRLLRSSTGGADEGAAAGTLASTGSSGALPMGAGTPAAKKRPGVDGGLKARLDLLLRLMEASGYAPVLCWWRQGGWLGFEGRAFPLGGLARHLPTFLPAHQGSGGVR